MSDSDRHQVTKNVEKDDLKFFEVNSSNNYPKVPEGFICSVVDVLRLGDEIFINNRKRPLKVIDYDKYFSNDMFSKKSLDYILWLEGNGTMYRLKWNQDMVSYPILHKSSDLTTYESYDEIMDTMRLRTMSEPDTGEKVQWVQPKQISNPDMILKWFFNRTLTIY